MEGLKKILTEVLGLFGLAIMLGFFVQLLMALIMEIVTSTEAMTKFWNNPNPWRSFLIGLTIYHFANHVSKRIKA